MRKTLRFLGIVFMIVLTFFPVKANAAGKNVCQTLKANKTYKYNLDKKGKVETIKFTFSSKDYKKDYETLYDLKTAVTVNGKEIYKKTLKRQGHGTSPAIVMVTDVNKKDKQMELLIIETDYDIAWVSHIHHIYYYRYANGKVKRIQDIAPLFKKNFKGVKALHGIEDGKRKENGKKEDDLFLKTDGKNALYGRLCVKTPNFDFSHLKVGLTLKNGKFKRILSNDYTLLDEREPYLVKKNTAVYTKAGGTKKAFTIKKKQNIYCSKYILKNKKVYLKVKNKSGKTGYIAPQKVPTYRTGTKHVGKI